MKIKTTHLKRSSCFNLGIQFYKSFWLSNSWYCLNIKVPYNDWIISFEKHKDNPSYKD